MSEEQDSAFGCGAAQAIFYAAISGPLAAIAWSLLTGSARISDIPVALVIGGYFLVFASMTAFAVVFTVGYCAHRVLQYANWTSAAAYIATGTMLTSLPFGWLALHSARGPGALLVWIAWCGPLCAFVIWRKVRRVQVPSTVPIN